MLGEAFAAAFDDYVLRAAHEEHPYHGCVRDYAHHLRQYALITLAGHHLTAEAHSVIGIYIYYAVLYLLFAECGCVDREIAALRMAAHADRAAERSSGLVEVSHGAELSLRVGHVAHVKIFLPACDGVVCSPE